MSDPQAWLEEAVDQYVQNGKVPDAYPPGVAAVRWEHNAMPSRWNGEDVWDGENPQPRPGLTFTAELETGEKIETWRP